MKWLILCVCLLWPTVVDAKWTATTCESLPYDEKLDAHVPASYWTYVLEFMKVSQPLPPPKVILAPFPKVPGVDTSEYGGCTDIDTGVIQLPIDLTSQQRTYYVLHEYVHSVLLRAHPEISVDQHHCWMMEHQIPLQIIEKFPIRYDIIGFDYIYMNRSCQFHKASQ